MDLNLTVKAIVIGLCIFLLFPVHVSEVKHDPQPNICYPLVDMACEPPTLNRVDRWRPTFLLLSSNAFNSPAQREELENTSLQLSLGAITGMIATALFGRSAKKTKA